MAEIKRLPGGTLPQGAPSLNLGESQHVEVFAAGESTAVLVVEHREHETRITQPWLSVPQDDNLARQLVKTIRDLYFAPEKPILVQVDASQTALTNVLQGSIIAGHIMTKPIDKHAMPPLAEGVHPRAMNEQETATFLADTEEEFARAVMDNSADPTDWEDARAKSRRAMGAVVPEGGKTPGHSFLIVEDDKGEKVSLLWVALNEETKESFCYNIEVEPDRRRMGYGRKTLGVWERHAAEQGAASIGLNVFGKNLAAQKLYSGAGLSIATTVFRIEE
ncbi:hypothetical protein VMCG_07527 [Cytospora schulzeri]|uniref:N-acetyltransferase domain-containing protein n=1 Tax=Cytospora schulzeri TaxID=448051 RepID=A0A423W1G5_9PEZI|nr:hypothetical protein VMCG_07527 [Valsa malicola]